MVRARYWLLLMLLAPLAAGVSAIACGGTSDDGEPPDLASIPTATMPDPLPEVILVEGVEPAVAGTRYTIQDGDTLATIAARFDTTAEEIAQANNITDPTKLVVGRPLVIPGGVEPVEEVLAATGEPPQPTAPGATAEPATTPIPSGGQIYTVQRDDNASDIADSFGITLEELAAANNTTIDDLRSLEIGEELTIPPSAP